MTSEQLAGEVANAFHSTASTLPGSLFVRLEVLYMRLGWALPTSVEYLPSSVLARFVDDAETVLATR